MIQCFIFCGSWLLQHMPEGTNAASLGLSVNIFPLSILLANLAGNGLNDLVILDSTHPWPSSF